MQIITIKHRVVKLFHKRMKCFARTLEISRPALNVTQMSPQCVQEVVELDGKVTKVTDSIETLQEIIHGLKVELEQLKRDHCAIMQYLLHLPVRASHLFFSWFLISLIIIHVINNFSTAKLNFYSIKIYHFIVRYAFLISFFPA